MLQRLPWDSEQLKLSVGRISSEVTEVTMLEDCLKNARQQGLQLLYWQIPQTQLTLINLAQKYGAQLVDHKVTYVKSLGITDEILTRATLAQDDGIGEKQAQDDGDGMEGKWAPHPPNMVDEEVTACYWQIPPQLELIKLAYDSGSYSRFRQDLRLTEAQFQSIYDQWLINSINRSIVEAVLVIYRANDLAGMVTVGTKQNRGDIGLLAVAENYRGQGIGQQLIDVAQQHFIAQGYENIQVVTQQQNLPACKLYEKCGFVVEKVDYFYHWWL